MSDSKHIVCPHCQALNRVPGKRLGDSPDCGKCHEPLFTAEPLALTAANFDRHIRRNDIPVLVDFWAPWCGPCQAMAPEFTRAAAALEPAIRVAKLDTEAETGIGTRLNIRSIPTLVLFHNGRETARQSGAMNAGQIEQWVKANTLPS